MSSPERVRPAADVAACQRKRMHRGSLQEIPPELSVSNVATPARGGFTGSPTVEKALNEFAPPATGGHIRVAVRVRPLPNGDDSIIEVAGEGAIAVRKASATGGNEFLSSQQGRTEERMFDRVFGPDATQEEVYAWCCRPLVSSAVAEGRSATVFVYGATGAGKTHTMFGERDEAQQGMISRAIREAFVAVADHAQTSRSRKPLEVKVSFLDIYNENVRDLLQEGGGNCKVLEDERKGVVKVTNLREVAVQSPDEALRQLRVGMQARKVEATAANARSSRSHAVFSMTLEQVGVAQRGPGDPIFQRRGVEPRRLHSRICLIDLAGSERATQTHNVGQALKDGAKINQSLLALANCIDALVNRSAPIAGGREGAQTPRKKPPYRDSKLTLLLKGSLTSDCMVSMIANVHPGRDHFEDSSNTLEYAKRASIVKAPVLVRRARANSLPASRPPSPSPPGSPGSSSSEADPAEPTIELTGEFLLPPPAAQASSAARPGASSRIARAPKLSRTTSAPLGGLRVASSATVESSSARSRESGSASAHLTAAETQKPVADGRIGVRPRAATPEERSSNVHGVVDRARAASANPVPSQRQLQKPSVVLQHGHSSASIKASRSQRPERALQEPVGRQGRPPCRHLARRNESPMEVITSPPSSFGTASPGESSAGLPEDQHPLPHPPPEDHEGSAALRTVSASASSVARSGSRMREPSLLDLDEAQEGDHSTSTSEASVEAARSPEQVETQAQPWSAEPAALGPRVTSVGGRPSRHAASPVLARRGQPGCSLPGSPGPAGAELPQSHKGALLLGLVDSLAAEKAALDERLRQVLADHERLEADNARLRAANLEKDRQLALLLGGSVRESAGGCSSRLSGFSSLPALATP